MKSIIFSLLIFTFSYLNDCISCSNINAINDSDSSSDVDDEIMNPMVRRRIENVISQAFSDPVNCVNCGITTAYFQTGQIDNIKLL